MKTYTITPLVSLAAAKAHWVTFVEQALQEVT